MEVAYEPLERLRTPPPVDRIEWLRHECRDRRVLDLGAHDETAVEIKAGSGAWLHAELAEVASSVVGVDSSAHLDCPRLVTSPRSVIVRGRVEDLERVIEVESFDVIVAGELIEHLEDPLGFLRQFTRPIFSGRRLLLSTPNAASLHNFLLGLAGRESTHRDHLAVYSLKTLNTLCRRAGFEEWRFLPYHVRFTESALIATGLRRRGVRLAERAVNTAERVFPMLSGGWIVDVTL